MEDVFCGCCIGEFLREDGLRVREGGIARELVGICGGFLGLFGG